MKPMNIKELTQIHKASNYRANIQIWVFQSFICAQKVLWPTCKLFTSLRCTKKEKNIQGISVHVYMYFAVLKR